MDIDTFNQIIIEHRDSILLIGIIILIMCLCGMVFVEVFLNKELGTSHFEFGKWKIRPSLIIVIVIIVDIVWTSLTIANCNADIREASYETYIGECEYNSSSVKLKECSLNIFVGKGHDIVPSGTNYGKCIYSKHARVIVYWEAINQE
ncbi:MAG: hypothetical protein E7269_07895 [Lachnospiraceae bacterium]|nr:hypothetical protein [Lachnospiraceae bacterium]